jgi:hypothetical protein
LAALVSIFYAKKFPIYAKVPASSFCYTPVQNLAQSIERLFQKKNCPTNFEELPYIQNNFTFGKSRLARTLTNNGKKFSTENVKKNSLIID